MIAYRNRNGVIVQINVDVGPDGKPILPPDTTVDSRPEEIEGHTLTVVGTKWMHIAIPVVEYSLEYLKQQALEKVSAWKAWYQNQPVEYNGILFDADETARGRLTQALVMFTNANYLPPVWFTYNNGSYTIAAIEDLKALAATVMAALPTRLYEAQVLAARISAATTVAELNSIVIPTAGAV